MLWKRASPYFVFFIPIMILSPATNEPVYLWLIPNLCFETCCGNKSIYKNKNNSIYKNQWGWWGNILKTQSLYRFQLRICWKETANHHILYYVWHSVQNIYYILYIDIDWYCTMSKPLRKRKCFIYFYQVSGSWAPRWLFKFISLVRSLQV